MIRGFHHVSMKCSPEVFPKAMHFYRDILGLKIVRSWPEGVMLDMGNGWIELFSNGEDDMPKGVIRHMALAVDSADQWADRVRAEGYEIILGPKDISFPSEPPIHGRIAFTRGPLGEEVEFFEER